MSTEQNKDRASRFVEEVINQGNVDRATEYFTSDFIDHEPPPGFPAGVQGLVQFFKAMRAAFPDFRYTVDLMVAEGDLVVQRVTGHGTMKASFMGMPATGKHAMWTEIHISRMGPEGKFVEHWATADQLGMLQQLGLAPVSQPSASSQQSGR